MVARLPPGVRLFAKLSRVHKFRISVFLITFFGYASYHLSRKPLSVVKNVLFDNSSCHWSGALNATGSNASLEGGGGAPRLSCGWAPFDEPRSSKQLLGVLDSTYWFSYAVGMFLSGYVADRLPLRYFLTGGMLLSAAANILFGMAQLCHVHHLAYFVAVQAFGGLAQSTGWPAVLACMGNWFGKCRRGLIMTLWNCHTSLGSVVGTLLPSIWLDRANHWGWSFIVPGFILLGFAVLVYLFLVPHPHDAGCDIAEQSTNKDSVRLSYILNSYQKQTSCAVSVISLTASDKSLATSGADETSNTVKGDGGSDTKPGAAVSLWGALRLPGVVEYALCMFFVKLVAYTFLTWLPNYIANTTNLSAQVAAQVSIVYDVGGVVGAIALGYGSDRLGMRAVPILADLGVSIPVLLAYDAVRPQQPAANMALLAAVGFLVNGPYSMISSVVAADLGTQRALRGNAKALATVSGIIDGMGSVGAAIGPFLTGLIAAAPGGWHNVFYMLIGADAAAILLTLRLVKNELAHTACFRKELRDKL